MFNLLKIPFIFLLVGILWALFSDPFITLVTRNLTAPEQDRYRSLNDFVFAVVIAIALHVLIRRQLSRLAKSEEEYRQLFESNPNAMWIYDSITLQIIKVNDAAVEMYGYSRNKFLRMTVLDFQLEGDRERLRKYLLTHQDIIRAPGMRQHVKAGGEIINVSVIAHPVFFDNRKCSLAMASDMTALLAKESQLQDAYKKNKITSEALVQMAWSNSHELRKPLCSILSLVNLIKQATEAEERNEFLELLEICSNELDQVLKQNSEKMTEIELAEM